jgi:hypothetical protein
VGKDYEAGAMICLACGLALAGGAHLHRDCLPDLCQLRGVHFDHGHEREPAPDRTGRLTAWALSSTVTSTLSWSWTTRQPGG